MRFHVDYFKGQGNIEPKPGEPIAQQAVVDAILLKHDIATNSRRFNAVLATSSINDAITYYNLFKAAQNHIKENNEGFKPLNITCVFSPPAEGNKDIQQIQEDLAQEKLDNQQNPEEKKKALKAIMSDYNRQYGTNHIITEFDLYYQDVQKRIKDHKYSNTDYPHHNKIDIVIVVDMLLTGFDSKYLNTLYVDKTLKYHGLIQAFSRTNRVLNDTKPYGNILDFRYQKDAVDNAITLFSGENASARQAKEIWLVDPAPVVIAKYKEAVEAMGVFMESSNLLYEPEEVYNLRGDGALINFIKHFKEVQRLKTQLDQYTDLNGEQRERIEKILPEDRLRSFRSSYLETAKHFKTIQDKEGDDAPLGIQQLDFEFVLFASAVIDYDYIMSLISAYTQKEPSKQKMTKDQLIGLLSSSANMMDERDDIVGYINSLDANKGLTEKEIREGYETFKTEKHAEELADIANKHGLETVLLMNFVKNIMNRMIFDGEKLTDLLAPLELSWKERRLKELALMEDLVPQLKRLAQGGEISGLGAYE